MTPCEVDYALQTLMSKIKERELESQRTLNEHEVTNRVLKRQLLGLQSKLKEKEFQLVDANETIRALRGVTQIITGLEDEIRALRTQLLTSQPIIPQIPNPAAISSPIKTQASDDLSHCSFRHPTEAGSTCSDYSSQNSIQNCTLLKMISESGRTTEVAVPRIKEEEQEVEMDGLERGGGEDGEKEEQALEEMVKLENDSEWDGSFEYNHAAPNSGELPDTSYTPSDHDMAASEVATPSSSSQSSDSAAVPNATNSRKRQLVDAPLDGHSASVMTAVKRPPASLKTKRQKRLVVKKAAALTKVILCSDEADGVAQVESRLADRTAQLAAEKARADERDAENVLLKAENDNLKRELQQLQSRETDHLDILQEMRAGFGELQVALHEQRSHSTPERPISRCASTTASESSTLEMSPLAPSVTFNNSIQVSSQHADVTLRDVSPKDLARIHKQSHGQVGRYGCLLFRAIISEENYRAWSKTTNWDGSRGKRALPQNVKNFVVSTLQRKFPAMGSSDMKDCIDKINEYLRTTRISSL